MQNGVDTYGTHSPSIWWCPLICDPTENKSTYIRSTLHVFYFFTFVAKHSPYNFHNGPARLFRYSKTKTKQRPLRKIHTLTHAHANISAEILLYYIEGIRDPYWLFSKDTTERIVRSEKYRTGSGNGMSLLFFITCPGHKSRHPTKAIPFQKTLLYPNVFFEFI